MGGEQTSLIRPTLPTLLSGGRGLKTKYFLCSRLIPGKILRLTLRLQALTVHRHHLLGSRGCILSQIYSFVHRTKYESWSTGINVRMLKFNLKILKSYKSVMKFHNEMKNNAILLRKGAFSITEPSRN